MNRTKIIRKKYVSKIGGRNLPISVYAPVKSALRHLILIVYGGTVGFRQKQLWSEKKIFAQAGYHAASFDFWGNTPNSEFYRSGLCTRTEDLALTLAELTKHYSDFDLTILGMSIGGYIATFFTDYPGLTSMILLAPAAYHQDAMAKRILFGPEFSELIRAPQSWANSDGFANIAQLRKPLLLVRFGRDNVVPSEVIERYNDAAVNSERAVLTFPFRKHKGNLRAIAPKIIWWLDRQRENHGRLHSR